MKADLHPDSHDTGNLQARTMVFPRYARDETQRLSPRRRTESFILAAYHSFNYSLLGLTGFETLTRLVDACACYDFRYSDLDQAVAVFEGLVQDHESGTR